MNHGLFRHDDHDSSSQNTTPSDEKELLISICCGDIHVDGIWGWGIWSYYMCMCNEFCTACYQVRDISSSAHNLSPNTTRDFISCNISHGIELQRRLFSCVISSSWTVWTQKLPITKQKMKLVCDKSGCTWCKWCFISINHLLGRQYSFHMAI